MENICFIKNMLVLKEKGEYTDRVRPKENRNRKILEKRRNIQRSNMKNDIVENIASLQSVRKEIRDR